MAEESMMEIKFEPKNDNGQTQGQSVVIDPQTRSRLFQRLPQELRDHIYRLHFSNTRLIFDTCGRFSGPRMRTAPNALALLLVCRQARLEIGNSWLRYVLFWYISCESMMDNLSGLPADTLSQIRHVRVTGTTLQVDERSSVYYPVVSILKLLPGLQLDQLTVLDFTALHIISYRLVTRLVAEGSGWKTLRYICDESGLIGFESIPDETLFMDSTYWRKPQPMHWQMLMERRDGVASNPSVTVYRAKEIEGPLGPVLDPSKRVRFEQKSWEGPPNVFPEDPELMTSVERWKEMLVVVKRGAGVDYEEKKDSPFAELAPDMRRDYPGMTWHQIRAKYMDGADDDGIQKPAGKPDMVDKYVDVDEYPKLSIGRLSIGGLSIGRLSIGG